MSIMVELFRAVVFSLETNLDERLQRLWLIYRGRDEQLAEN